MPGLSRNCSVGTRCAITMNSSVHNRFTIDHEFVAMTADWATYFDGDSFSRSFRMDAPLMPKTGELKL
jgi:carbonic anhydrase/acetyltransferase-like protein (isoleucine patch superfamily)